MDRFVGFFSPRAEANRIRSRVQSEMNLRAYDVAKNFTQSDWTSSTNGNANAETKAAIGPGRSKARALSQNAPYGVKAIDVIVAETIGAGIVANITGRNKTQTKNIQKLWKQWAESSACDVEGRNNFYSIQEMVLRSTVESGEGLLIKNLTRDGLKLKILESDFISTQKDTMPYIQGIEVDPNTGARKNYCLFQVHPGASVVATVETYELPASLVAHVYRQKRPGQVRGISWAHAVIEKMKDFDDYQSATLIRQKIAACFGGFVTTTGNDSMIDASTLKEKRTAEFQMEPATFRYLSPGEDIKLATPPGVDGYGDFNRETLRAIASGWGISYESLTGDYSQSNYSSSRMGHLQMRKNIETWRWNMFIPQFCDPVFSWFLESLKITGIDVEGVSVKWVPPAYSMIDPSKELDAVRKEVRSGLKSWGEAVQEQGRDPDEVLQEISDWNTKFDEKKIVLDTDPRKITQIGMVQSTDPNQLEQDTAAKGDTNSGNSSQKDATGKPNSDSN